MNKRWVTSFFCIVVLLASIVSVSADETVFDGDIGEEESEEIDGITYTVYEYLDYEGVRISSNDYGSVIVESIGSSTSYDVYTYTLNDIYEGNDNVYFSITVEKEGSDADVSFSRSPSNYNPVLGEHVDITITIQNDGDENVDIRYLEDLPSEVTLLATPDITVGSSTQTQKSGYADIYFDGVLYGGESVVIEFSVEVDTYPNDGTGIITFDDVEYTYEDDYGETEGFADPLSLTLDDPLAVTLTLYNGDEEDVAIGDELEYTITLSNYVDETITVDPILIEVSSGLEIVEADLDFEETDDGLSWSGELAGGEDYEFYVVVSPIGGGDHTLSADATYWYEEDGETYDSSDSASFSIDVIDVVPMISLNSGATYDGGEEILIEYKINNSDPDVSYSNEDVAISTDSDFFSTLNYVVSIPANSLYLVKKQNFTAPYSDSALSYTVEMEGTYGGSPFSTSETFTINAVTFTVPYAIEYTAEANEDYTSVIMEIILLTTLTDTPSSLAVVHTGGDYKKTVSLGTDQIATLFSDGTVTRTWEISTAALSGDELDLDTQLQYTAGDASYYKSGSITLPVYSSDPEVEEEEEKEEEVEEETDGEDETEESGKGNETIATDAATESDLSGADEAKIEEEETGVVITGEKEHTAKKWVLFILILVAIGLVAISLRYFVQKKQKEMTRKKRIEQISGQETTIVQDKKQQSLFEKAKEIIIHDVPTPEQGYEKLQSFINHSIQQGKTTEEIKKILVAKGWIEDVLDSFLKRLK